MTFAPSGSNHRLTGRIGAPQMSISTLSIDEIPYAHIEGKQISFIIFHIVQVVTSYVMRLDYGILKLVGDNTGNMKPVDVDQNANRWKSGWGWF